MFTNWWKELDNSTRAKIVNPFIQICTMPEKPWKPDWQYISDKEFEKFVDLARSMRKTKIQALEQEK